MKQLYGVNGNGHLSTADYLIQEGMQEWESENGWAVPPCLHLDFEKNRWTLDMNFATPEHSPYGEYAFGVLCNGKPTGDIASRIEMYHNRIRIFTASKGGWKYWNGRHFI